MDSNFIHYNSFLKTSKHYVYGLSSSDSPNVIRYIGQSKSPVKRYSKHKSCKGRITKTKSWIISIKRKGADLVMTILSEHNTPEETMIKEIETIQAYKDSGANLTNLTKGGEGTYGYTHPPEVRAKISKNNAKSALGRIISLEQRREISERLRTISSKGDQDKFISLFYEGKSTKELAKHFNVCANTVTKYYKRFGLSYSDKRVKFIKIFTTKEELEELYIAQNLSKPEISEILGITVRNLKKRLKDFGIKKSPEQVKQLQDKIRNRVKSIDSELSMKILKDRENKMKIKDIAEKYELTFAKISNHIYKHKTNKS